MNSLVPKEGTIFKKDKSKKLDFVKTYTRIRFNIFSLIKKDNFKKSYKREDSKVMQIDNFLKYIEEEQYEI